MTDKIDDIYSFYDALLRMAGLETKTDGSICVPGKVSTPTTINGKNLVLPLKSRLKNPNDNEEIFFHPLAEQMQRYESEVFKSFKRAVTVRLIAATTQVGLGLLQLQNEPAVQRKLSIEQIEVIKGIKTFDKNSLMAWAKMLSYYNDHLKFRMDKWPIHIYLKRNGNFDGKSFRRVAVTSFPFAEEIVDGKHLFNDSGKDFFRNKDYDTFSEVFQAIFPEAKNPGEVFNAGWNDAVAPYLSAFLLAVKKIIDRINGLCDMFAEVFGEIGVDVSVVRINYDWHDLLIQEGLNDYTVMSRVIPQLKGNTGATSEDEENDTKREESATVRRDRPVEKPPVKEAVEEKPKAEVKPQKDPNLSEAEQKLLDEARAKKAAWKAEQEELEREDAERRKRREERQREQEEYDRQRRDRDTRRDDPPWDEDEPPKKVDGKISASDIFGRRDDRRDDRDYRRDDRDYHDRRDDRDYRDRRDDRYYRRDDRDRDFFDRDRRDDRDYRRDDRRDSHRDSPWDRRDRRDDRYDRRDRRDGPWGRR